MTTCCVRQLSSWLVKGQHGIFSKSLCLVAHIAVMYRSRTDDVEALQSGGECVRAQNS